MSATTHPPPHVAPADDPLTAALSDPATEEKLRRHARAVAIKNPFLRLEVDDIVQATRLRVLELRDRFDPDRCRGDVGGWLYRILERVAHEEVRRARKLPALEPADRTLWEAIAPAHPAPGDDPADRRFLAERFLAKLRPDDRAIIKMKLFEDRDFLEIAARTSLTYVNVRARYYRAINELKAHAAPDKEDRS
jgi:RNA polymerase sigma factor (sigma-70 family)